MVDLSLVCAWNLISHTCAPPSFVLDHYFCRWDYRPNFFNQPSFTRIMVTGGTTDPPLKIMADASKSPSTSFMTFDRML
jgi:hypothetical protein